MLKQKTDQTYDAIMVLGYSFDEHGQLPEHLVKRLELAADLWREGTAPRIIVCGLHSVQWDWAHVDVDVRECDLMQHELIMNGVPSHAIIREHWSQDTPGNFYFTKSKVLMPHGMQRVLILCATHHLNRVRFLSKKILGPNYHLDYQATYSPASHNPMAMHRENRILAEQKRWLALMEDGDHNWFKPPFYSDPYYKRHQAEPHNRKIPAMLAHMGV